MSSSHPLCKSLSPTMTLFKLISKATKYVIFTIILISSNHAYACVGNGDVFNPLIFIIVLSIALLIVLAITLLIWLIGKVLNRKTTWHTLLFIPTVVISIFLIIFDAYIIPRVEALFNEFGAVLPKQTIFLLSQSHRLWLPLVIVISIWYVLKNNSHKIWYYVGTLFIVTTILSITVLALYSPIFKMGSLC